MSKVDKIIWSLAPTTNSASKFFHAFKNGRTLCRQYNMNPKDYKMSLEDIFGDDEYTKHVDKCCKGCLKRIEHNTNSPKQIVLSPLLDQFPIIKKLLSEEEE